MTVPRVIQATILVCWEPKGLWDDTYNGSRYAFYNEVCLRMRSKGSRVT